MARNGDRPAPGQYNILDNSTNEDLPPGEFSLTVVFTNDAGEEVTLSSTGGTVTIDQSSTDVVSGTFEAPVAGIAGTAMASGNFTAIPEVEASADGG